MALDIRTLAILLTLILAMAALVLALLARLHPGIAGPRHWALGMTLIAAGFVLIFARGAIAPFWSVAVANIAVLAGYLALYLGVCRFCGTPPRWRLVALLALAGGLPFLFTFNAPEQLETRILVAGVSVAALSALIAATLAQANRDRLLAWRVTALVFVLHGSINLLRALWTLRVPPGDALMEAGGSTMVLFGWSILGVFLVTALLVVMTGERLRDHLEQKLRELDKAHREALAARAAERRLASEQRQLLAMVAHEVRNPVGILLTASDLIAANLPAADRESAEELARITRASQRLRRLVDGCMALDGIDSRAPLLATAPVDLAALLAQQAADFGVTVETTNIRPAWVEGDAFLLGVALANLLANACKFARQRSAVTLCLEPISEARGGAWARIEVRDDGPGVAAADRPHLFDKFYRGTPASGQGGAGLGLYLVRRIADLHGGRAELVSTAATGSRFRLSLPLAEASDER